MWFINCGYLLLIVGLNEVVARVYPVVPKIKQNVVEDNYIRPKRQFGFQDSYDDNPGPQNNDFSSNDDNAIFFDDDNMFDDFVRTTGSRGSNQNNNFPNFPSSFDSNLDSGRNRPTTQTPLAVSPVNVPGMGTTRSQCEDLCQTTSQYNPVCGDNQVTYINIQRFNCAVRCGRNVQIAAYRACPRIIV